MGGSYGGYATLVGLTFTPDVFACGVDIVGPSNIVDAAQDDPAVLGAAEGAVHQARRRPGEGGGVPERALAAVPGGPDHQAAADRPGGERPAGEAVRRATRSSRRCARTARRCEYVLYPDEGHGFARPENRLHFFAVTEQFLAKHLGGRAEPVGEIKGASGVMK